MTSLPQNAQALPARRVEFTPAVAVEEHTSPAAPLKRVLYRSLWLILLVWFTCVAVGIGLYVVLGSLYPRYTAKALLDIRMDPVSHLLRPIYTAANQTAIELEQSTQIRLLRDPSLLEEVLQKSAELRGTQWYQSLPAGSRGVSDLAGEFSVSAVQQTRQISVAMTCASPDEAKQILEIIVNRHLQREARQGTEVLVGRQTALNTLRLQWEFRLLQVREELKLYTDRAERAGGSMDQSVDAVEAELRELTQLRSKLQEESQMAAANAASLQDPTQQNQMEPQLMAQVQRDPAVASLKAAVAQVENELIAVGAMGTRHPKYQALVNRKNALTAQLRQASDGRLAALTQSMVEEANQRAAALKDTYEKVANRILDLNSRRGGYQRENAGYLGLRQQESKILDSLYAIERELSVLQQSVTGEDPATPVVRKPGQLIVGWSTKPESPRSRSFPQLPVFLAGSFALGLMAGVGAAFLRDVMDNSIRSPRDVQRVGHLNLLGVICEAEDDPQAAQSPAELAIFSAPHSLMAEQIRQIRARLTHLTRMEITRSLLITSPGQGDGKSTVAANLAAALAINGRRILLIDANFRRPTLANIFNVSDDPGGFADALLDPRQADDLLRPTPVPNLWFMAAGKRPANAAELLESPLLGRLMDQLLQRFDQVIFDSGPILLVSETVALASHVDGVVSVVRAQANSRDLLLRMRDALSQLPVAHLGVILNGVRVHASGYYGRAIKAYYQYQQTSV